MKWLLCALAFGRDGVLSFGIGFSYAEWLRCAPPSCDVPASFPLLAVKSVPSSNELSSKLTSCISAAELGQLATSSAPKEFHCRLSRSRRSPHCFLLFWFLALPKPYFNCCFPGLSLLFLQEIIRHGSNIAQLQHMPKAANFQRHISPPHPPRLKRAFIQPPQASSTKLPRDQC